MLSFARCRPIELSSALPGPRPRPWRTCARTALAAVVVVGSFSISGCASPGPPRSPSLNLPGAVSDLAASRKGEAVDLSFTVPQRNTDRLPLHAASVTATLCRAVDKGACLEVAGLSGKKFARVTDDRATVATLRDILPDVLTIGPPRLLSYRVELFNPLGHTAGYSEPAYVVAGAAPTEVQGLAAQGSRLGVVLSWQPGPADGSEVVLRREDLSAKPNVAAPKSATGKSGGRGNGLPKAPKTGNDGPNTVWLGTTPPDNRVLDTTALLDVPYRYSAERRLSVKLEGRTLEIQSEISPGLQFVLHDVYPPPPPTDLTAAGYPASNAADPGLEVDLIWQPVNDARLSGYNVYRQALGSDGKPIGENMRLNKASVMLPAFHDALPAKAASDVRYRYSVTAVDAKGNESAACTTTLDPNQS